MVSGWDGAQTDGSGAREAETAGTPADVWFEIRWSGLSNGRLLAKGLSWLGVRWVGRAAAGRVKPHVKPHLLPLISAPRGKRWS